MEEIPAEEIEDFPTESMEDFPTENMEEFPAVDEDNEGGGGGYSGFCFRYWSHTLDCLTCYWAK